MTTIRFDDFLKEQLQDPNFKAGFEVECAKLSIAVAVMQAREHAGLTRAGLAEKAGVPMSFPHTNCGQRWKRSR